MQAIAVIRNRAPTARTAWARVAISTGHPLAELDELAVKVEGEAYERPAILSRKVGRHSRIHLVAGHWEPGDTPCEVLKPSDGIKLPDSAALHPWVSDAPGKLIARPVVRMLSGQDRRLSTWMVRLLRHTKAEQAWYAAGGMEDLGLWWKCWTTFFHDDPVAQVKMRLCWSDRNSARMQFEVAGVMIESGEPIMLEDAVAQGAASEPVFNGGRYFLGLSGPRKFVDGSSIRAWGSMMCLPEDGDYGADDASSWRAIAAEQIAAGPWGPVEGVLSAKDWNGNLLALGSVPRWTPFEGETEGNRGRFEQLVASPGDLYRDRPMGIAKYTGQTGSQEDFGVNKAGQAITLQDVDWLRRFRFSFAEPFRGFEHHESNGAMLQARDHPGWITWTTRTNLRSSTDRLGKPKNPEPPNWGQATGWFGMDENHRSHNGQHLYLALTGDELVEDVVRFRVQTDIAQQNDRLGSTRAGGRLLAAWANDILLATDDATEQGIAWRAREKRGVVVRTWRGGQHPNPVKVVTYNDDRRMGVFDPETGQHLPAWSVWEHGLALIGYTSYGKVVNDDVILRIAAEIGRTIIDHATVETQSGQIVLAKTLWYPQVGTPAEGQPLGVDLMHEDSWVGTWGNRSTSDWTKAGLLVWRDHLAERFSDLVPASTIERCDRLFRQEGLDRLPADRVLAEWRAGRDFWLDAYSQAPSP